MAKGQSLQDPFLKPCARSGYRFPSTSSTGIKLQGQIDSFDQFVVLLKNSVSQMVYKHAISTGRAGAQRAPGVRRGRRRPGDGDARRIMSPFTGSLSVRTPTDW